MEQIMEILKTYQGMLASMVSHCNSDFVWLVKCSSEAASALEQTTDHQIQVFILITETQTRDKLVSEEH
jgi:hypothetical protein